MGLSSKEVSNDGVGWSQSLLKAQTLELPKGMKRQNQQNQQPEQLKCPRCDSSNTKFCYYNNYNKSQPRHFCKACKRHWTKGGTLRNVPVGGGRKNKRLRTSSSNTTTSVAIKNSTASGVNTSNIQFQVTGHPPSSSLLQNPIKSFSTSNGVFLGSSSTALSLPQTQGLQFPFSSSSSCSFETTPSSISNSFQSPSIYNYTCETMEDPTITSMIMPTTSASANVSHTWEEVPITRCDVDTSNYWNWDDIDALVSTDVNIPWDDFEIKP